MNTGFRSLHPLPAFLYYAGVMVLSMLLLHPIFLASALIILVIQNVVYETRENMFRTMILFSMIGVGLLVLNPMFSHRGEHILFYLLDQPITWEAVCYGITITLSTLAILLSFMSYRQVITTDKFLYLFSYIWPKGTLIIVMGMRFVPLLLARLKVITQIQGTKGITLHQGSLRKRARDGMSLLQVLLTWSLEEALQTADSMKARGYGLGPRSTYTAYRMRSRDWRILAFMLVAGFCCVIGRLYGYGYLTIYPSVESWGFTDPEWILYTIFLGFVGTPLFIEGKEWLRWHLSR